MKKSNMGFILAICMIIANASYVKADTADYTGGLAELDAALNGTASTRNFYQTDAIKFDSNIPGINTGGSSLTINGNHCDIDGNSNVGFSVNPGQTLNINNVGSLSQTGAVLTSLKNFYTGDFGGAAIVNNGGEVNIKSSVFTNNVSGDSDSSLGGAIWNYNYGVNSTISNSTFDKNSATWGGAIANFDCGGNVRINNSTFSNNYAGFYGGAIYNYGYEADVTTTISNSRFIGNSADYSGGAIYNRSWVGHVGMKIDNSTFIGNHSDDYYGGAIFNVSGITQVSNNSYFYGNYAQDAGAIFVEGGVLEVSDTGFEHNYATLYDGGAIDVLNGTATTISNSYFKDNNAAGRGGAIFNSGEMTLINTIFVNNKALAGDGGAIYNAGTLNVVADNGNSIFTGNQAKNTFNAIYLDSGSTLNLNTSSNSSIIFNDKITADTSNTTININKSGIIETNSLTEAPTSGTVRLNNTIAASNINLYGGTLALGAENLLDGNVLNVNGNSSLDLINGSIGTMSLKSLNLAPNTTANLGIDVNLAQQTSDKITAQNSTFGPNSSINISKINALTDSGGKSVNIRVADSNLANYLTSSVSTVMGPIFKYNVNYDASNGSLGFSSVSGGSYTDYNPSILSKTISSLTGTYLNQVNVYSEALGRAELFMSLPQTDRLLMRYQNKYASAEDPMVFSPLYTPSEKGGIWFKQYTTFENIPLNNGPNVSNVGYGALVGADTEMKHLKHGCDGYLTAYAGYNGSHQNYNNVGIYQDGGVLGLTGTLYKNNFFTALTANVGATNGNSSSTFGTDNFTTLLAGLAWKAGYNIELMRGKIIIQPSYAMSYTFADTFDYQTASGINITSDPLNALQIAPGVKIIGNLKNNWQPFLAANMVWNIMDAQRFHANNVELPMMTIAPYVEYGLGVQRRWGDRFTGFAQAMLRGGGRNGIALQFGFRFAIGK